MLEAFITSRARRVLLTWFITHPGERFHMQQLIRDLDLSSSQIQNELARLESVGFLKSRREANARFFEINPSFPLLPEVRSIIYKTTGLADFVREAMDGVGTVELAAIFGSVATGTDGSESDIDLLVIGEVNLDALHDAIAVAEKAIGREINPHVVSRGDWMEWITSKQAFAMNIMRSPTLTLIGDASVVRGAPTTPTEMTR